MTLTLHQEMLGYERKSLPVGRVLSVLVIGGKVVVHTQSAGCRVLRVHLRRDTDNVVLAYSPFFHLKNGDHENSH